MKKENIKYHGSMKEMVTIALPMLISHASETAMIFTDRVFLSKLGAMEMNAAMGGGLTCFLMMTFFIGLIGYSTALIAQYLGANRKHLCSIVTTQTVIIAFIAFPVILISKPLAYNFFKLMGIHKEQQLLQVIYFNILIYMTIFSLLKTCLSSFFSGVGKTKIVMQASISAMIINIIANYVLIFGKFGCPKLGIEGAALGTILGSITSFLVLLVFYLKKENIIAFKIIRSCQFNKMIMKQLFRYGSPAGIELLLNMLAFNTIVFIFHAHSTITATAATIVFNWDMVSFVPLVGIEIGVTSLVGRYMGAKSPETAHKATISGLKLGWIYSSIIFILFIFFPEQLVSLFSPESSSEIFYLSLPLSVFMLRLAAIYVTIEAVVVVFIGALRGAGDTFAAMILSTSLHWILVPVLYFIFKYTKMGAKTGWSALVAIFTIFSIFIYLRYKSGKWKKISIIPKDIQLQQNPADSFNEMYDF